MFYMVIGNTEHTKDIFGMHGFDNGTLVEEGGSGGYYTDGTGVGWFVGKGDLFFIGKI
jgi:hypothetical protein